MSTVQAPPPATPENPEPRVDLGRPITGPTALGDDWRRLLTLSWTLAVTDFKMKFFGSILGYLWQIMRPLLLFGVLFLVFSVFLKFGEDLPFYAAALLLGIVLYGFLSEATGGAVRSLITREPLVRKVQFPRLAVPLSVVLTALFNFVLNIIPVFIFLFIAGGKPLWSWWQLPFLVLGLALFAFGLAMLLSALFVRYRDVEPIWDVILQVMFYASPVIYPIEQLLNDPALGKVGSALMANPFAAILQQARHAVVSPEYLSAAEAIGSPWRLLIPVGIVIASVVGGFIVFSRAAPRIAEEL